MAKSANTNKMVDETAGKESASKNTDLGERIVTLYANINRANAQLLTLIAEFDDENSAAHLGFISTAHWLNYKCGIGMTAAREKVRVARALVELPAVAQCFSHGQVSYSKVRALTRVATAANEAALLDIARHATASQAERIFAQYRQTTEIAQRKPGAKRSSAPRNEFASYWDDDGYLVFRGRLSPEQGALVLAAMQRETDGGVERTEAIAEVARRSLSAAAPEVPASSADRYQIHVELSQPVSAPRAQHLRNGPGITDQLIERLTCDASVIPHRCDDHGEPLNVGRKTRTINPALRRALVRRDGGCRFPGCTHQHFVDAHHVKHWARGGETKLSNLVLLCSKHHKAVHEEGFRVVVDTPAKGAARFLFYTPTGEYFPPVADDLSNCAVINLERLSAGDDSAESSKTAVQTFDSAESCRLVGRRPSPRMSPLEPRNPTAHPDYEHINWVLTNFHPRKEAPARGL